MTYHAPDPLPAAVIDRLFSALSLRYGNPFLDRWRDLDLTVVKDDWARQLAGASATSIKFALNKLPERPPTVIDFRKLVDAAPHMQAMEQSTAPVRGPTPAEREVLRELAADIRRGTMFRKPGREWARDLLQCHQAGWRNGEVWHSTPVALQMAREALREPVVNDDWGDE